MPLRTRLFIIISLVVLFILGVSTFLLVTSKKKKSSEKINNEQSSAEIINSNNASGFNNSNNSLNNTASQPKAKTTFTPLEIEQNAVKQLAKIFVERYGSFSTQNNFQNIKDVETEVTPALWKKISGRVNSKPSATSTFMAVTTNAFVANIAEWQDSTAKVELKVRRTTEKDNGTTEKNETVRVTMIKLNNSWLVDSFSTVQ